LNIYGDVDHFNMSLSNVYETDVTGVLAADGQPVTGVADQTSWGNELELGGRIGAGRGYFDVFGTAYRADTLAAVIGGPRTPAPGVPMQVYSFIGKYTFAGGVAKGFMIGGGAYGSTPRYELNLPIHTPTEINVFTRYQIDKHWSAQVNIDNVTNRRYVVRIATPAFVEGSFPMEASLVTRFQW
jgi:outer membrane receptor protein involved in Fe transport